MAVRAIEWLQYNMYQLNFTHIHSFPIRLEGASTTAGGS
jgi:hypothetical protein